MIEWTNYAVQLSQQLGLGFRGKPAETVGSHLNVEDLDKFTESQIIQLYELMRAATEANSEADASSDKTSTENEPATTNKNA